MLYADYSDPDAIRVGEDYWLTASSFNHAPGLPILHSRDLVNWTIVNHALPALVPRSHFALPRHGQGVWAPSIRHHAGRFWIYYPDPDFGIYVVSASDPRETWSEPVLVKAGKGLIDPCPFWDEDGRGYLIHAWARSRAGISNRLTLHRLSPDGVRVEDAGLPVIDADRLDGWNTLEGPKLYRRGVYYYVFAPAGGVRDGYQAVFRSRDLYGPYENRIVLAQGGTGVNGPHQGAWVETAAGEHWFLHFQELPAYGRVMHLQPMAWGADDWPTIGRAGADGIGEPVPIHRKPVGGNGKTAIPATSDEFAGPALGRQWQWQANPSPDWASLSAAAGSLRLSCFPLTAADTHWAAPHLLLQKFPGPAFVATTRVRLEPRGEGDTAGLMVFGNDYYWLGLRQSGAGLRLVLASCAEASKGGREIEESSVALSSPQAELRVTVSPGARCRFAYRLEGAEFRPIGGEFGAVSAPWVGAKLGLFASAPAVRLSAGHADFSWFRVGG